MKRNRLGRPSGFDQVYGDDGDINPMENMINLTDIMLVLAVGIMCALVIYWNIDITNKAPSGYIEIEVEDAAVGIDEAVPTLEELKEYGTVYIDNDGKLYIRSKDE